MSFIRKQSRQLVYNSGLKIGFASTADSIDKSPPAIHDAFQFQNSNWGLGEVGGRFAYRPGQSTNDRVQPTGDLDGDAILLAGDDYLDNSDLEYEFVGGMHPDELNECIRLALRRVFFKTRGTPLTFWADGDMSATGVTHWSIASATATRAKDDNYLDDGFQTLEVTTSTTNGYVQSDTKRVNPGDKVYHAANVLCPSGGTAQYILWDVTHGRAIRTITAAAGNWMHLHDVDTVPDGCYGIAVRLGATGSGVLTVWGPLPAHDVNDKKPLGPSWLAEKWQLIEIDTAVYDRAYTSETDSVASRRYEAAEDFDYDLEVSAPEGNPSRILFHTEDELPECDIWLYGQRRFSDRGTMENETDSTEAPEDYWRAAILYQVALIMDGHFPDEGQWKALAASQDAILAAQRAVDRPTAKPEHYSVHMEGGRI